MRSFDLREPRASYAALESVIEDMASLRERVRLLEAVFENFPGGISLFDATLRMVLCNQRQKTMLEYPEDFLEDGYPTLEELFRFNAARGEYGPGCVEEIVQRRMDLVHRREPHCYDRVRPNGDVVEVRGLPLGGGGFVTTYLDVTEQRRNQSLVAHLAHHDPLTDLPNRILFNDRLATAVAMVQRGGLIAVHYMDLDRFKPVNDRLGHDAGDAVLVEAARRMRLSVREGDTVARLGGDEFGVVQTGIASGEDAVVLARRMLEVFAAPFEVAGSRLNLGLSIGIALAPNHGRCSDDLLRKADSSLYRSKRSGRGRFSVFAPARA